MSSAKTFAQGKFLEGYIVSVKGDTLNGFIKYRDRDKNPTSVDFSNNKKGSDSQKLSYEKVREFYIPSLHLRYKSKKIGVLDIQLDDAYTSLPSIAAKDSTLIYLKEVTSGPKATLYVLSKGSGSTHYFLEKDGYLTELINYPFYRTVKDVKYLTVYDEYKNQLPLLTSDSEVSKRSVPSYKYKDLLKYVSDYNMSFGESVNPSAIQSSVSGILVDMNASIGIEGWQKDGPTQKNKLNFGIGMRLSLPNKFHNRYVRLNLLLTPGVSYIYRAKERTTFYALEAGLGTHLGSRRIRPFAGLGTNIPINHWKIGTLGPHIGVSYLRQFNIEISNFANLYSLVSQRSIFNRPRVSLNYYLNLNTFFNKK